MIDARLSVVPYCTRAERVEPGQRARIVFVAPTRGRIERVLMPQVLAEQLDLEQIELAGAKQLTVSVSAIEMLRDRGMWWVVTRQGALAAGESLVLTFRSRSAWPLDLTATVLFDPDSDDETQTDFARSPR